MNLAEMRLTLRRDLHDEDVASQRWSDSQIERHILHALKDFSAACPREMKTTIATVKGCREINLVHLEDRVSVDAVEYPAGLFPPQYQRFSIYRHMLHLTGDVLPDGSDAIVYYGALHILDDFSSSIPAWQEDLVAVGAAGYAALAWALYAINRTNTGGNQTTVELGNWGQGQLAHFRRELHRLSRNHRVRVNTLFSPRSTVANQVSGF